MTKYTGIPFNAEDTVLELKRKINQKLSIPVEKQRLELNLGFENIVLQNSNKLREKSIKEDTELFLLTKPRNLVIYLPNSETINLSIQNEEKIGDVFLRTCG